MPIGLGLSCISRRRHSVVNDVDELRYRIGRAHRRCAPCSVEPRRRYDEAPVPVECVSRQTVVTPPRSKASNNPCRPHFRCLEQAEHALSPREQRDKSEIAQIRPFGVRQY